MAKLFTAPTYAELTQPLVFLAGPIQGALDWQAEAIELLTPHEGFFIASPRRAEWGTSEQDYLDQVDWEHFHLDKAADNGVILFWLAPEHNHVCERAYAQTTRFELGETVTLHRWQGVRVVVGIDEAFSNARYLRHTIAKKAPQIPICESLANTCETVIAMF